MSGALAYVLLLATAFGTAIGLYFTFRSIKLI